MSRTGIVWALALVLAVFEFGSTQGLRCYQCTSESDSACRENFSTSGRTPVDCESANKFNQDYLSRVFTGYNLLPYAPKSCVKFVLQSGTTVRTCIDHNAALSEDQACNLLGFSSPVKHCSLCQKDSCNGAGAITASVPLAFLALIASYLYYKQ